MIAKITRGARVGDLAAYLHGPGTANEHVYDGRAGGAVIGGNLGREGDFSGVGWAMDLREVASNRRDVAKPIWHMSVRCAPTDRVLSDAEWAEVALEMGESMGWADCPWVVVRHADDHVHIAVSRVGHDGRVWYGRNDAREAQRARGPIERRLGLVQTPTRSTPASKRVADHQLTHGEHAWGSRLGRVPGRVELATRVRGAVQASAGTDRGTFERALTQAGVEFRVNEASTGRVSGYSVHAPGHTDAQGQPVWFKTSQLDRELSWKNIEAAIAQRVDVRSYAFDVKRRVWESGAGFERRVQEVADRRRAQEVAEALPYLDQNVAQKQPDEFWRGRRAAQVRAGQARAERAAREQAREQEQARRAAHEARIAAAEAEQARRRAAGLPTQVIDRRDLSESVEMTPEALAAERGARAARGLSLSEQLTLAARRSRQGRSGFDSGPGVVPPSRDEGRDYGR